MSVDCAFVERVSLIPANYDKETKIISVKCPDCKTIFTIKNEIYTATKKPADVRVQVECPKCSAINIAGVLIDHTPKGLIK